MKLKNYLWLNVSTTAFLGFEKTVDGSCVAPIPINTNSIEKEYLFKLQQINIP